MAPKPNKKMASQNKKFLGEEGKPLTSDQRKAMSAGIQKKNQKLNIERARAADKKATPKKNAGVGSRGPKAGSSIVSKVVKRAKTVAREARDIPTAVGGIKDVLTNKGNTKPKGGTVSQLKSSIKNVASQVKETGKAAATGKKGRPAQKYQTSRGNVPATFWTQPKRK